MTNRLVLEVWRQPGGAKNVTLQVLDERDAGHGYRLHGPKMGFTAPTLVLRHEFDERDAKEVRNLIDAVFPKNDAGGTQEAQNDQH